MDTETRLTKIEERLDVLERQIEDGLAKAQDVLNKVKKHPLFGQFTKMLG